MYWFPYPVVTVKLWLEPCSKSVDKLVKSAYPSPADVLLISPTSNSWNPSPKDVSAVGEQLELFTVTVKESLLESASLSIFTLTEIS